MESDAGTTAILAHRPPPPAIYRRLTVVTRDIADFKQFDVPLFNPFEFQQSIR